MPQYRETLSGHSKPKLFIAPLECKLKANTVKSAAHVKQNVSLRLTLV